MLAVGLQSGAAVGPICDGGPQLSIMICRRGIQEWTYVNAYSCTKFPVADPLNPLHVVYSMVIGATVKVLYVPGCIKQTFPVVVGQTDEAMGTF